jgi:ribosomal protein S18 acetylase RimI-like enzyme
MEHKTEIRAARNEQEFLQVAHLHQQYIPLGFLSSLGIGFLARMYALMAKDDAALLLVAVDRGTIVGFVSGTVDVGSFYRRFIRKNILWGFVLLPKLVTGDRLKRALETLLYPRKNKAMNLPKAELLSIVVDHAYQGRGVATVLYEHLEQFYRSKSIPEFKIIVGSTLTSAICFYQKVGATKLTEIEVHKGFQSWVMHHQLR